MKKFYTLVSFLLFWWSVSAQSGISIACQSDIDVVARDAKRLSDGRIGFVDNECLTMVDPSTREVLHAWTYTMYGSLLSFIEVPGVGYLLEESYDDCDGWVARYSLVNMNFETLWFIDSEALFKISNLELSDDGTFAFCWSASGILKIPLSGEPFEYISIDGPNPSFISKLAADGTGGVFFNNGKKVGHLNAQEEVAYIYTNAEEAPYPDIAPFSDGTTFVANSWKKILKFNQSGVYDSLSLDHVVIDIATAPDGFLCLTDDKTVTYYDSSFNVINSFVAQAPSLILSPMSVMYLSDSVLVIGNESSISWGVNSLGALTPHSKNIILQSFALNGETSVNEHDVALSSVELTVPPIVNQSGPFSHSLQDLQADCTITNLQSDTLHSIWLNVNTGFYMYLSPAMCSNPIKIDEAFYLEGLEVPPGGQYIFHYALSHPYYIGYNPFATYTVYPTFYVNCPNNKPDPDNSNNSIGFEIISNHDVVTEPIVARPNPAHDDIVLNGVNPNAFIEVYDALGRPVLSTRLIGQTLPLSSLPVGVYSAHCEGQAVRFLKI